MYIHASYIYTNITVNIFSGQINAMWIGRKEILSPLSIYFPWAWWIYVDKDNYVTILFLEPKCTGQEKQVHVSGFCWLFFLQSFVLESLNLSNVSHELPAATWHVKIDCDNVPASSFYAPFSIQCGPAQSENKSKSLSWGAS